ncbi:MAG TPA: sugar phosphate isomerase/epimerase [Anditalea sp.]|nr:sugar phosphate isomerase/epimerase [Anditalea sp.]
MMKNNNSRRGFLKKCGGLMAISAFSSPIEIFGLSYPKKEVILSGHVWLYASKFPPDWDCTPIIEEAFRDFRKAGLKGMELMESNLRDHRRIPLLKELINKYKVPVTGCSYYGDMWNKEKKEQILEDVELVTSHLQKLGGSTFGITVGDAGRKKTENELDSQGDLLMEIMEVCSKRDIVPNLHNHTFEMDYNLNDFLGTIARVPDLKLGPDINWLMRAGIDPVWFIEKYGHKMVYLHLRDQDKNGKWTRSLGEGVTDFKGIAKALTKVDFSGRAAIELAFETPPTGSVTEEWIKSRKFVTKVFSW